MAARINDRVRDFHSALLSADCGGKTVLRTDVERLVMEQWGIGVSAARSFIDTGRALGLWMLVGDPRGAKGSLERTVAFGPPGLLISDGKTNHN